MVHKVWKGIEKVPYSISKSYMLKKVIWLQFEFSQLTTMLQFEFIDGYKMTHLAFRSMEEMPYCFLWSFVKFQGHTSRKIDYFAMIWAFPDNN